MIDRPSPSHDRFRRDCDWLLVLATTLGCTGVVALVALLKAKGIVP